MLASPAFPLHYVAASQLCREIGACDLWFASQAIKTPLLRSESQWSDESYGKDEQVQDGNLPSKLGLQQQPPAVVNILDAQKSVRLVERPLEGSEKTLTLEVTLKPLTEMGN